LQKNSIIRDYLEDINEIPKCRMFWPREIWSKYADKLEVRQSIYLYLFPTSCTYPIIANDHTSTVFCLVETRELHWNPIINKFKIPMYQYFKKL
jgi:hypothetical protein